MINIIFACDKNYLIGAGDKIPWHYKEDLLYYKSQVEGHTVLMGLQTYLSLKGYYKNKPLPYGKIYVASLDDVEYQDCIIVKDVKSFLEGCSEDLWVIGGATIFRFALPFADKLYITHIDKEYEGNIYFPEYNHDDFKMISQRQSKENPELKFTVYERRKK